MARARRAVWIALIGVAVPATAILIASKSSPWPSALVMRWALDSGGVATNTALAAYVPAGIRTEAGVRYDQDDPDALLDIHRPSAFDGHALPVIVWIHGGGFVAGSRGQLSNYARILAGDGHAVVVVDYSLAPAARYPMPVRQVNRALAFLSGNAARLQLDRDRFILGGDSAGAQIASQLAALVSSPAYAASMHLTPGLARGQLRGLVLFCGPHDALLMGHRAASSWYLRTVMWSYLGSPIPSQALLQEFSVVPHVTSAFPPAFITVGNADPLAPQSLALADTMQRHGVRVETLFYPVSHAPPLPHEYQFDLSRPESREALERTRTFIQSLR